MKKFDLQHIFGYILRDIETIALSSQEFGSTISAGTASKELQSPFKLLSNFLIDLSDLNHAFFSAYMSVIARYLDGNSYSLRIAALTIMGCFIVKDRDREVVSDRCGPETNDSGTIDVDGNQNTVANITHNKFYSYLKSHLYDANAFVRSKCFQILSKILTFSNQNSHPSAADEERCIMTNSRILTFAKLAHERLEDKSSNVRKNALQFLTHTICQKEVNIYLATAPEVLQAKIAAGHEKIARNVGDCARLVEQKMKADNETENCLMNGEDDANHDKFTRIQVFKAEIEDKINEIRNMNKMDMEILEKMKFCVDHFNLLANQVYPHVIDTMLFSKSQTDCLEAIAFLVTGLKCKIYGSGMSGIKKCLQHLAISSSANASSSNDIIRDKMVNIFANLFFASGSSGEGFLRQNNNCHLENTEAAPGEIMSKFDKQLKRTSTCTILENLLDFIDQLNPNEMICFEELMKEFMKHELFPDNFPRVLLQKLKTLSKVIATSNTVGNSVLNVIELEQSVPSTTSNRVTTERLLPGYVKTFTSTLQLVRIVETGSKDLSTSLIWNNLNTLVDLATLNIPTITLNLTNQANPSLVPLNSGVLERATIVVKTLHKLRREDKVQDGKIIQKALRLSTNHACFVKFVQLLLADCSTPRTNNLSNFISTPGELPPADIDDPFWCPYAQSVIQMVYALCERPEQICQQILYALTSKVFRRISLSSKVNGCDVFITENEEQPQPEQQNGGLEDHHDDDNARKNLSKLIFVVGEIALHHFTYIYDSLLPHIKFRGLKNGNSFNMDEQQRADARSSLNSTMVSKLKKKKQAIANLKSGLEKHGGGNIFDKQTRRSLMSETSTFMSTATSAADKELCLVGTECDDIDAEFARHVCEVDIFENPHALLKPYLQLVEIIVKNPVKYSDFSLRNASLLTLIKFMIVSSKLCEKYLPLVFTILSNNDDTPPTPPAAATLKDNATQIITNGIIQTLEDNLIRLDLKVNIVVGIGDLIVRFPTLVEPWINYLYERLTDHHPYIRLVTLKILSHLISRDMIIAKEQLSEMAKRIIDPDDNINRSAKIFFDELSNKGNCVYNALPDIIGKLSVPEINISREDFTIIMKYLCSFIQKDKQIDGIIEKTCQRMNLSNQKEQIWRLMSCLSYLPHTDRSIKKLIDDLPLYQIHLDDPDFRDILIIHIIDAHKPEKIEFKSNIEEFKDKVNNLAKHMDDMEVLSQQAKIMLSVSKKKKQDKTPKPLKTRPKRFPESNSVQEDNDKDENHDSPTPHRNVGLSLKKIDSKSTPKIDEPSARARQMRRDTKDRNDEIITEDDEENIVGLKFTPAKMPISNFSLLNNTPNLNVTNNNNHHHHHETRYEDKNHDSPTPHRNVSLSLKKIDCKSTPKIDEPSARARQMRPGTNDRGDDMITEDDEENIVGLKFTPARMPISNFSLLNNTPNLSVPNNTNHRETRSTVKKTTCTKQQQLSSNNAITTKDKGLLLITPKEIRPSNNTTTKGKSLLSTTPKEIRPSNNNTTKGKSLLFTTPKKIVSSNNTTTKGKSLLFTTPKEIVSSNNNTTKGKSLLFTTPRGIKVSSAKANGIQERFTNSKNYPQNDDLDNTPQMKSAKRRRKILSSSSSDDDE